MLIIRANQPNTMVVTVSQNSELTNPEYLFSFTHIFSKQNVTFIPTDISTHKSRYDEFYFVEGNNPGEVNFPYEGLYLYAIYEQQSGSGNLNPALAYNVVENGEAQIIIATATTMETNYDIWISPNENNSNIIFAPDELNPASTPSITPSLTPSMTPTASVPVTPSVTPSLTPTLTSSPTPSVTTTLTPSVTPSLTSSPTPSVTPTITPSVTISATPTLTPTPSATPGPAIDPDAATYLSAVVANGGTLNATISAATDTLFLSLKSAGIYSKIKRMYPFLGSLANTNKINAVSPSTNDIIFNGGWTHDYSGSTSNGINAYGNLGIIGVGGEGLVGNNYHHSLYIQKTGPFGYDLGGSIDPSNQALLESTDFRYSRVSRQDNAQEYQSPPAFKTGFFGNSSDDPTFTLQIRTTQTPRSFAIGTWTLPTINLYLAARNDNGSIVNYADRQYSFLTIGTRLTDGELSSLESVINTFQTSIGRNIY